MEMCRVLAAFEALVMEHSAHIRASQAARVEQKCSLAQVLRDAMLGVRPAARRVDHLQLFLGELLGFLYQIDCSLISAHEFANHIVFRLGVAEVDGAAARNPETSLSCGPIRPELWILAEQRRNVVVDQVAFDAARDRGGYAGESFAEFQRLQQCDIASARRLTATLAPSCA